MNFINYYFNFFSIFNIFIFLKNIKYNIFLISLLFFLIYINIFYISHKNINILFEKANAYHNIKIYNLDKKRIFSIDGGYSSGINLKTKNSFFRYIKEAEKKIIEIKAKNVLVIGAAGFSLPNDISKYDFVKNIDVIDVDSELKNIAEKYFLQKKLSKKINFYPIPSRFFINEKLKNKDFKKYDFILVDAYSGKSPPPQVLTYEFFEKLTKIGDNIYLNIILDKGLKSNLKKIYFQQ